MVKIYEEESILHPESDVDLETKLYYSDRATPTIVFAVGLGGSSKQNDLISQLVERGYSVRAFSPRNSGKSTGHLTSDNYILDLDLLIGDVSQKNGERPFAIGHSFGGYALAKIFGRYNIAKKSVLLSPLLSITEQIPKPVDGLLRNQKGRKLAGHLLNLVGLDDQKFTGSEDGLVFLNSLYSSESCVSQLQVPTYVLLTGTTNLGLKIRALSLLKRVWEDIVNDNSKVEIYAELNHYFVESNIPNGRRFFEKSEKTKIILDEISEFLS